MVMDGSVLLINEKEATSLLGMKDTIKLMENCFHEFGSGRVINPIKLHLSLRPEVQGYINSMPSYMVDSNIMGCKMVGVFKNNGKEGLPATLGVSVLFNPQNGAPYTIMDATHITNIRTGAIAGVQAKYLTKKGSKIVTIIGAGAQGLNSFEAVQTAIGTIEECRLVDINPAMVEKFTHKAQKLFPNVKYVPYTDIQTACTGSDIVVPCATATKPLLRGIKFDKGTTIIVVAEPLDDPKWVRSFDKTFCDFPACMIERMNQDGRYYASLNGTTFTDLPEDMFEFLLGDVVCGKISGRDNDDQIILSATVGMSMYDNMCAEVIYQRARDKGMGVKLPFMDMEWNED